MGRAGLIAAKDLRLRLRDRSVVITGILAPLALAFVFDLVFAGALTGQGLDLQFGHVDEDRSPVSTSLATALDDLEDEGILDVTAFSTRADAEAALGEGDLDAFILIEPGLQEAALSASEYTVRVVGDVDSPTSTQVATSIAEAFASGVGRAQLSVITALELLSGPPPPGVAAWGEEAGAIPSPHRFADLSAETRQLDASTFFAAGMAVFFLFFTVQFGVLGLLEEERDGTMARLLAAPVGKMSIIAGKGIISFALGALSMTVLVVATAVLMGADWGPPLGVALLVGAGVLSGVGIMALVAAVARTPEGAGNLGSIIAVALGMLGGTFFPVGQGDDLLSRLTLIAPHAWFMRGLADISGGADWTAALPSAGAMSLFAVVFGSVGWLLLRRRLAR